MKSSFKKAVTALLAAALLAAAPCTPVFGAQTYYVNDGSSTLTMADAYAVGASGDAAKLPERWQTSWPSPAPPWGWTPWQVLP